MNAFASAFLAFLAAAAASVDATRQHAGVAVSRVAVKVVTAAKATAARPVPTTRIEWAN